MIWQPVGFLLREARWYFSLLAWGDWLTPETMRDRRFGEPDAPSLVPRSWRLGRQADQEMPEVLAEGVLAYDFRAGADISQ